MNRQEELKRMSSNPAFQGMILNQLLQVTKNNVGITKEEKKNVVRLLVNNALDVKELIMEMSQE